MSNDYEAAVKGDGTAPMARPLTPAELEEFAIHCGVLITRPAKDKNLWGGRFSMSCRRDLPALEITIRECGMSEIHGSNSDAVTMGGRAVGNRVSALRCYARYVSGDPEWFRWERR